MSQPDLEKLIHAFIFSRIDYCNSVFTGLSNKSIKQLQLIQNAAAGVLTKTRKIEHITPVLNLCSDLFEGETFLKCEAGWEKHGGNCYYFSTSKSSWINSRRSCVDLGSDLVKIDSREEQLFLEIRLRGLMMKDTDKFWIGLTDSVEEGKWFWVDGSPLDERLQTTNENILVYFENPSHNKV
uniref:C-type lectin domain-containing protein n=1 Tax=Xiphophorus couchianus TaxID=32473 RepID=A0A3B5LB03_9TELE